MFVSESRLVIQPANRAELRPRGPQAARSCDLADHKQWRVEEEGAAKAAPCRCRRRRGSGASSRRTASGAIGWRTGEQSSSTTARSWMKIGQRRSTARTSRCFRSCSKLWSGTVRRVAASLRASQMAARTRRSTRAPAVMVGACRELLLLCGRRRVVGPLLLCRVVLACCWAWRTVATARSVPFATVSTARSLRARWTWITTPWSLMSSTATKSR
mmetsp:Transcript_5284/g.13963  ORF Transcript_5284/g.13963 Transcript_5284/m.13963 type:complete len:215 (+) Transcript_5284:75-719(+)